MSEAPSIPRRQPGTGASDFDGLRAAGIRLLEQVSGETWTDYNLHDPGITILEHLAYGLTDLMYRVGFDVEDHLAGAEGAIDFAAQALHLPADILPCRPTTAEDRRRRILDCVEALDDAWVRPVTDRGSGGGGPTRGECLHEIVLRMADDVPPQDRSGIVAEVLRLVSRDRNLGEDVAAILVAQPEPYHLVGDVDITGSRPVADILADVYGVAEAYVAGRPRPLDPGEALAAGTTLDEVFTGPVGRASRPLLEKESWDHETIFVADIVAQVQAVEGVADVRNLHLLRRDTGEIVSDVLERARPAGGSDRSGRIVPLLEIPAEPDPTGRRVRLWRYARRLEEPRDFAARYRAARGGQRVDERRHGASGTFYAPPDGEHRPVGRYRSIQQHFPAAYGINAEGVPGRGFEDAWLHAFRLKSYLLILEQWMANYLADLHHLRDLYSVGDAGAGAAPLSPTYRFRPMGAEEIPGFDRFYGEPWEGAAGWDAGRPGPYLADPAEHLARVIAEHDDALDRRSRLQDHLLAVFGESLAPGSGSDGGHAVLDGEVEELIERRARMLRELTAAGRDRGGGSDPLGGADGRPSGFGRRLELVLGAPERALLRVLDHVLLRPAAGEVSRDAWDGFYGHQASVLFADWVGRAGETGFRRQVEDIVAHECPASVHVRCFWLSREAMARFEGLEATWLAERARWLERQPAVWVEGVADETTSLDGAASEIVRFVWELRRSHDG